MAPPTQTQKSYTTLTDEQLTWPHWVYQWICIYLVQIWLLSRYRIRIQGKENQPRGFQSYIVACNHTSNIDPPLLSFTLRHQPIVYMAKRELYDKPLMRWYQWAMSSFAVNREKLEVSSVKTALKVLKHGKWALGLFPEGTRQKDGQVGEAKKGVAYFAKASGRPVLPVGVYRIEEPPRRIEVRIGKLIPPQDDLDALTQQIQQTIAALVEEAKAAAQS